MVIFVNLRKTCSMKRIALIALSAVALSCTKDLNEDNDFYFDDRNVWLKMTYEMGDEGFHKDSVYVNDLGVRFKVKDVRLLINNFYVTDMGDTVNTPKSYTLTTLNERNFRIGKLNAGSYSGYYHFTVGLDSATNATSPGDYDEHSPLSNSNIHRGSLGGYNHIIVTGEALNPLDTSGTGLVPFKYVVGTTQLAAEFKQAKNFSVGNGMNVTFDVTFDLAPLFSGMNFIVLPEVKCDPEDAVDYGISSVMQSNFVNNCLTLY